MKRFIIVLTAIVVGACHHSMDTWSSDGDRQEVAMFVRTRSLSSITAAPSVYQLVIYDSQNQKTSKYNVNSEQGNQLHLKLFPGTYTGYCTTNAESEDCWEFSENSSPENIYLKGQKSKDGVETPNDHLLGKCEFEVKENTNNQATFDLSRQVGMIRLNIENIPEWLSDLEIHVTNIPQKMSLTGIYSDATYTIVQTISPPDENGISLTDLLVFPPKEKSVLTLSSNSQNFITPDHVIDVLNANQITEIKVVFHDISDSPQVDFSTHIVAWEDEINYDTWKVDLPQGPCQGTGNGHNLLTNGSFEDGLTDNCPNGWKFNSGGSDKRAIEVNSPAQDGNKAIRLEGKTQLYQEIGITGGQCYQLKMFVNAPLTSNKWRYWITWMKDKTDLSIGAIHPSGYQKQTEGYIDTFDGMILRAPQEANKLHLEIRNYSDLVIGEGLFVDAISVETVE